MVGHIRLRDRIETLEAVLDLLDQKKMPAQPKFKVADMVRRH
jgi:hypothetical protein